MAGKSRTRREPRSGERLRSAGQNREQEMAYLAKIERSDAQPTTLPAAANSNRTVPDFSPLEWSVIRLARMDPLWTIRSTGQLRRFWNWLVGRGNPELANPKLEALRRMAVLSWHYGFSVPGTEIAEFLSFGFTPDQYELMAGSINSALSAPRKIAA
jgi:hypothetical protein